MALYRPDYQYINGKEALEKLDTPQGELIRYYVAENEKYAKKLQEQIDEMQKVFYGIRKFVR